MKLVISNSGIPIYGQLKAQIQRAILSGELCEGDALPSLRTVAKELRISVLTATRAYTELEQEGYVRNVQGKGCYVLGRSSAMLREQMLLQTEDHLRSAVQSGHHAGLTNTELHNMLDFAEGEENE